MTLPSSPTPKSRRFGKIFLVVSLALNLALVGVLAGGAMRGLSRHHGSVGMQPDFRTLWRALPRDVRNNLRAQAGSAEPRGVEHRAERRRHMEARNRGIVRLLRADPFDAPALEALLGRERLDLERRLDRMRRGFVEELSAMSPAQRQQMADELEETWRARGHFGPDDGD